MTPGEFSTLLVFTLVVSSTFCADVVPLVQVPATHGMVESGVEAQFYAKQLLKEYGHNWTMNADQLQKLLDHYRHDHKGNVAQEGHSTSVTCHVLPTQEKVECLKHKCLSSQDILSLHSLPSSTVLDINTFTNISATILYQIRQTGCKPDLNTTTTTGTKYSPSTAEVWGWSFLSVTVINLCALFGAAFHPLMKTAIYRHVMTFMVALAVGTLCGTGLLVLIPESLNLMGEDSPWKDTYVFQMTAVVGGVYLFFLLERMLHTVSRRLAARKAKKRAKASEAMDNIGYIDTESGAANVQTISVNSLSHQPMNSHIQNMQNGKLETMREETEVQKEEEKDEEDAFIKPVAWMIIFGDALHNTIDGIAIGAAFSKSPLFGLSVSLAIVSEELPHELGDFAIMLNSGMTVWQAMGFNFLSACMCYVGLVMGIVLGEFTTGAPYVFGVAGGMFLYISLVDMMPELGEQTTDAEKHGGGCVQVFILQNLGLAVGFCIILVIALYGNINLEEGITHG